MFFKYLVKFAYKTIWAWCYICEKMLYYCSNYLNWHKPNSTKLYKPDVMFVKKKMLNYCSNYLNWHRTIKAFYFFWSQYSLPNEFIHFLCFQDFWHTVSYNVLFYFLNICCICSYVFFFIPNIILFCAFSLFF